MRMFDEEDFDTDYTEIKVFKSYPPALLSRVERVELHSMSHYSRLISNLK